MKDVGGVAETRSLGRTAGRTDGVTHTRTDEGHFYSPPPPTSGDNKSHKSNSMDWNICVKDKGCMMQGLQP